MVPDQLWSKFICLSGLLPYSCPLLYVVKACQGLRSIVLCNATPKMLLLLLLLSCIAGW